MQNTLPLLVHPSWYTLVGTRLSLPGCKTLYPCWYTLVGLINDMIICSSLVGSNSGSQITFTFRYSKSFYLFFHLGAVDNSIFGVTSSDFTDPELRNLASTLPDLIENAYAKSTLKKYKPAWNKWINFTNSFQEINACPADPLHVALYLNHLTIRREKVGAVTSAFLAIRWGHIKSGLIPPTDHPFVQLALEGAKRTLAPFTVKNRKDILENETLIAIATKYSQSHNLLEVRAVVMFLLGFSGFMRIKELLPLQLKHLSFTQEGMKIFLEMSKTDQLREGETIFISETKSIACPVAWTKKYIALANITKEDFVICRLAKCKIGHKALGKYSISYSSALENIRIHLPENIDPKTIGTHSLRAGGASSAANAGVSDRMISKHGRWSLGNSRDRYIKDSHTKRFSVSRKLGL